MTFHVSWAVVLLLAAVVCFVLAAFSVRQPGRLQWIGLGLLFWALEAFLVAAGVL
jgi:hypothetical protein